MEFRYISLETMRHSRAYILTVATSTTMTRTLELNCLVLDGKPSIYHILQVKLSDECTVATLKEKINEKRPNGLREYPAVALELWTVSILAGTEEFSETYLRDIQYYLTLRCFQKSV